MDAPLTPDALSYDGAIAAPDSWRNKCMRSFTSINVNDLNAFQFPLHRFGQGVHSVLSQSPSNRVSDSYYFLGIIRCCINYKKGAQKWNLTLLSTHIDALFLEALKSYFSGKESSYQVKAICSPLSKRKSKL